MRNKKITQSDELKARYERYKKTIENLTLMNNIFMRNVFKQKECLEYVLRVIMDKKELKVVEQVIQKDYKNLQGRSGILDCVAKDSDGKQFNVEIQQDNEGASPKRARYHSGLMDMNTLNPGENFTELPETYVIFIVRDDILGYNLPIYHVERMIKELDESFRDEAYIIYVNSKKQDETELGMLMHDLYCKNADEMHSKILAKRVRELKDTENGVDHMCKEMDKIYNEGMEIGEKNGIEKGIKKGIRRGIKKGIEKGQLEGRAKEIVESGKEFGLTDKQILERLKNKLSISKEKATEYMEKYSA